MGSAAGPEKESAAPTSRQKVRPQNTPTLTGPADRKVRGETQRNSESLGRMSALGNDNQKPAKRLQQKKVGIDFLGACSI